eukprot:3170146-Amphidinium_carterae.1
MESAQMSRLAITTAGTDAIRACVGVARMQQIHLQHWACTPPPRHSSRTALPGQQPLEYTKLRNCQK